MTKAEFVRKLGRKAKVPQKLVNQYLEALQEIVAFTLERNSKVTLPKLGTLFVAEKKKKQTRKYKGVKVKVTFLERHLKFAFRKGLELK